MNLSAYHDPEAVLEHLVFDALALADVLPALDQAADRAETTKIVDLGSGAGLPAIPLAIKWPNRNFVLVEAREKRVHFLRAVIRELGLKNVKILHGRAEHLPAERAQLVIAQAMAAPAQVLEWMLPWAKPGAALVIPIGDSFESFEKGDKVEQIQLVTYTNPALKRSRKAWVGRYNPAVSGS